MGDFLFLVFCGSRVWFLSVCACVLWVKFGFVFMPLFWCGFLGFVWVCVGFCGGLTEETVPFLSQKG